jgi:solute carrier family 10 (sodium/bile acid cotransporter), member 7
VFFRQWFLCVLVMALAGGLTFGCYGPAVVTEGFLKFVHPVATTALVLFLMSFSLDTTRLWEALRHPHLVFWSAAVNLGLVPLLAWPFASLQSRADFSLGLMIAAIAPCTLATASVFTRRAGGNDAISLLVTLLTNVACVIVSPLWLRMILRSETEVELSGIVEQLTIGVLLPTVLGQIAQWPRLGATWSQRYRGRINLTSQWLVLLLVLVAATRGGMMLRTQTHGPDLVSVGWLILSCVIVHLLSLWLAWAGAIVTKASRENTIAVAFAASQKTLPISLLMAMHPLVARDDAPFLTFPLLAFHAGQLLLDAMLADWWARQQ